MDVLITGATGYIGGAVAAAAAAAGHRVQGLAATEAMAEAISARGWEPVEGDLREAERLRELAGRAGSVIHLANTGDADAARVDIDATRALGAGARRAGGTFLYTSGAWVCGGGDSDESTPADPPALVSWRAALERELVGGSDASGGPRAVVVRPGVVYGAGAGIPGMVVRGEIPVIGTGRQQWPLVHLDDLSDLYIRALSVPPGVILHGVAHTMSMLDLAVLGGVGGKGASLPPSFVTLAEARARYGPFADALHLDQRVSSKRTRELTLWVPSAPSPVEEILTGSDALIGAAS